MHETLTLDWLNKMPAILDEKSRQSAQQRQDNLTKPTGALGRLEELAIQLAAMQHTDQPAVDHVQITVFAADHGVADEQVSAYPQTVTGQMLLNFASGGAAINVLARILDARLDIVNLGTRYPLEKSQLALYEISHQPLGPGTRNFLHAAALDNKQLAAALAIGRKYAERAYKYKQQLFVGGDMGIGNTTSATALACALLDIEPAQLVGPGSGLNEQGIMHKTNVIVRALQRHHAYTAIPLEALRRLGGFEIAALVGAYIRCAQLRIPVMIDGFISSVAALTAESIRPHSCRWFLFAHRSAEPGHIFILQALKADPLFDLSMRLGEGSGAALAISLLRQACALHNEMATFTSARVANRT